MDSGMHDYFPYSFFKGVVTHTTMDVIALICSYRRDNISSIRSTTVRVVTEVEVVVTVVVMVMGEVAVEGVEHLFLPLFLGINQKVH